MNAKAVVFILCRLLAIYLIVVHLLGFVIQTASALFAEPALRGDVSFLPIIGAMAFGAALYGFVALFLWIAAGWLARLIASPFPDRFGDDINLERWQAVVVMSLGGMSLLSAAAIGGDAFKADTLGGPAARAALHSGIGFLVLGLGLIVFARWIVLGLKRLNAWGNKPFVKADEQ